MLNVTLSENEYSSQSIYLSLAKEDLIATITLDVSEAEILHHE